MNAFDGDALECVLCHHRNQTRQQHCLFINPSQSKYCTVLNSCQQLFALFLVDGSIQMLPLHYGRNRPFECHSKIFHSMNYQFGPNFKVQLYPLWL